MSAERFRKLKSIKRQCKRVFNGKAFSKSEFGTNLFNMTLRGILAKQGERPSGEQIFPTKLELKTASAEEIEPVRIYIGSEPAQHRAERVLLWSIFKHHNPARHYEIYIMKNLSGFDRRTWKTGFTGYRYAIPEFARYQGKAIYNDVDQIYLRDPAELYAEEMSGAAVLAVESRDTSVMLLDCDALACIWTFDNIKAAPGGKLHATMLQLIRDRNLIADLPGHWNARDHEFDRHKSSLLHYTILHTQPWKPFPKDIRYKKNPQATPWHELEEEADHHDFAPLWKAGSARSYEDMEGFFTVTEERVRAQPNFNTPRNVAGN